MDYGHNSAIYYMNLHTELMKTKFPLEHPLYGRIESLQKAPFLTPAMLAEFTNTYSFEGSTELEVCPQCFFQTSGTTGRSKKIPYSEQDLERQKEHEALAFSIAGMSSEDVILTLAAPPPSISAWATINGSRKLGAEVVNTSYFDYEDAIKIGASRRVTTIFATPIVAQGVGELIQEKYGSIREVFPKLKRGIIFGDVLPPNLEKKLIELWDFEIRRLYGSVEADVLAIECGKGKGGLHIMADKLIFEIIPEEELKQMRENPDYSPRVKNIFECEDGERGEILVTDLIRDLLPLVRYRVGDIVEVHKEKCECGRETPRIRVLGRAANTVYLEGGPVYEMQLHLALNKTLGSDYSDWKAYVRGNGTDETFIDIRVETKRKFNSDIKEKFLKNLRRICSIKNINLARFVDIKFTDSLSETKIPKADEKSKRIIFA